MKYMILMQTNTKEWGTLADWTPEDGDRVGEYMNRLNEDLARTGEFVNGEGLGGPKFAKIVRATDGEPIVTDGPFPEAKEFLAGYWIVDVATPERAIEIAERVSKCPGPGGVPGNQPVEVHPVLDGPPI